MADAMMVNIQPSGRDRGLFETKVKTDDRKLKSIVVDPAETRGKKGEPLKIESVCASVTKPDKDVSNLPQIPKRPFTKWLMGLIAAVRALKEKEVTGNKEVV